MTDREALRVLKLRKSVLDYSLRELDRLKALGPASERDKIDGHAAAVRKLEAQLSDQIAGGGRPACSSHAPIQTLRSTGKDGDSLRRDYDQLKANTSDETTHEAVGKAHAAIIRAAFACDLIRVATFQWSPGTNHVAFKGLDPNAPETIWMHHPLSHQITDTAFFNGPRPDDSAYVWDAMVNANRWYFQKTADIINEFRLQVDPQDPGGRKPARSHRDPDDHRGGRGFAYAAKGTARSSSGAGSSACKAASSRASPASTTSSG